MCIVIINTEVLKGKGMTKLSFRDSIEYDLFINASRLGFLSTHIIKKQIYSDQKKSLFTIVNQNTHEEKVLEVYKNHAFQYDPKERYELHYQTILFNYGIF